MSDLDILNSRSLISPQGLPASQLGVCGKSSKLTSLVDKYRYSQCMIRGPELHALNGKLGNIWLLGMETEV